MRISIAATLALALVVSCKEIDKLTHFSFESSYVVVVPPTPVSLEPVEVETPEIRTSSDGTFESNNTKARLIEEIQLSHLVLTVTSPSNGNLKFLKSVEVFARAEGLPEIRVASKSEVPSDIGQTLELEVTDQNLKEYFQKESYTLRVVITTDEPVVENHLVDVHAGFRVDAKVLGI